MYCETYRCQMNEIACAIRRRNALADNRVGAEKHRPGATDINCRTCQQGAAIAAQVDAKAMSEYSAGLRQARRGAQEAPAAPEPQAPVPRENPPASAVKTCGRASCIHRGRPQSVDNFFRNKAKPDGRQDHCKDCHRELMGKHRGKPRPQEKRPATRMCKNPACVHAGKPQPPGNFVTSARFCNDCRVSENPPVVIPPLAAKPKIDHAEIVALLVAEREFHLARAKQCDAAIAALR